MSHLVIYDRDGTDQYQRFAAIEEAVALVERLRNDGNESARLYRLEEVQFEVRAYYRVEVGSLTPPSAAIPHESQLEAPVPPVPPPPAPPIMPEPLAVEASFERLEEAPAGLGEAPLSMSDELTVTSSLGGARRGLFGR